MRDEGGKIRRTALGRPASRRTRLLSGFLECGECGGSYHALTGKVEWGCSWHRNRGACDNGVRIPQAQLEAAVLTAVREAIDEEVAAHALEVALEELRRRMASAEPTRLEEELAGIDAKIARLLDMVADGKLAALEAAKEKLSGLHSERQRVAGELDRARRTLPTLEELKPRLREMLREIATTLRADVTGGRLALGALLGDRRLRVYQDGRIEGVLRLDPETKLPAPGGSALEPAASVVAGER